ncbi:GNAT family N-acetyltransferase [Catellatospora sp. KI3]|uniref:GNAT family N-acetyltransferase n=1 Tax=Catellatospora sp. KI3 TaxID=3041620 RepID=UPI002482B6E0|nr:GNAT family N-acetyltransferase [Catellatospora sp. KI3]MDI1459937.1 GNAT family N-acetyltransferase [Catellatospora sp. KI3]
MSDERLPEGWMWRPTTADDAADLLALVHASDMSAIGFADFTSEDVADGMSGAYSEVAVAPNGAVAGWAYLDPGSGGGREFAEVYVHPEGGLPAQRPLLARAVAAARAQGAASVRTASIPSEHELIDSITAAGFAFVKQYARMGVDLPAPVGDPVPGVAVRTVTEADLPEFFEVFDAAFRDTPDYQPSGYPRWRERFVDGHPVRFDEWFAAEVDGRIAGVLQSAESGEAADEGWVKHLAVRREHRRRGVGRALLAAAFARYLANGRSRAGLGVDLANPTEAIRLYTGVGMRPVYQANVYEREL